MSDSDMLAMIFGMLIGQTVGGITAPLLILWLERRWLERRSRR